MPINEKDDCFACLQGMEAYFQGIILIFYEI